MSSGDHSVLVIGVGNQLRGDDAAGLRAAGMIGQKKIPGVEVWTLHQLHVEILEDLFRFSTVIVMDAAVGRSDVTLEDVDGTGEHRLSSSHHLGLEKLAALAQTVYQRRLNLKACSIPGRHFDMSEALTPETEADVRRAVDKVVCYLKEAGHA